jgi:hypothetical protein
VVAASEYKSLGKLQLMLVHVLSNNNMLISMHCGIAVYDINKSTMREKDHYELVFVRYLYNTHNDDICCLASISSKYM